MLETLAVDRACVGTCRGCLNQQGRLRVNGVSVACGNPGPWVLHQSLAFSADRAWRICFKFENFRLWDMLFASSTALEGSTKIPVNTKTVLFFGTLYSEVQCRNRALSWKQRTGAPSQELLAHASRCLRCYR